MKEFLTPSKTFVIAIALHLCLGVEVISSLWIALGIDLVWSFFTPSKPTPEIKETRSAKYLQELADIREDLARKFNPNHPTNPKAAAPADTNSNEYLSRYIPKGLKLS